MRQRILDLLALGRSYNQIVAELGCAKSTVAYHAKNVKPAPNYKVHDWAAVQSYYDAGHGVNECRRAFGICAAVWYNAVKAKKITALRDHRLPLAVLTVQGRKTVRTYLKIRLIKAGLLETKCAKCGLEKWGEQPLSLEMHHINGINNDNRLENLQLLCPNCHSQTPNYSGRSIRNITNK